MGFQDWFAPKPAAPDLTCPDCGWQEFVPFLDVVRVDAFGVKRVVGYVARCAKCKGETVLSQAGVYQARTSMPQTTEPMPKRKGEPITERILRDTDMPWEGKRKR